MTAVGELCPSILQLPVCHVVLTTQDHGTLQSLVTELETLFQDAPDGPQYHFVCKASKNPSESFAECRQPFADPYQPFDAKGSWNKKSYFEINRSTLQPTGMSISVLRLLILTLRI